VTVVKAAAVQISPVLYSRAGTIEKVVQKIRDLGGAMLRTCGSAPLEDARRAYLPE
jgi:hypothetical protein